MFEVWLATFNTVLSKKNSGTCRRQVTFIRIQNQVLAMWTHGWYRLPQSNSSQFFVGFPGNLWLAVCGPLAGWVHYMEPSCCLTQCSEDIKAVVLLTKPLRLEERSHCASRAPEYSISHLCVQICIHIHVHILMCIYIYIYNVHNLTAIVFVFLF